MGGIRERRREKDIASVIKSSGDERQAEDRAPQEDKYIIQPTSCRGGTLPHHDLALSQYRKSGRMPSQVLFLAPCRRVVAVSL